MSKYKFIDKWLDFLTWAQAQIIDKAKILFDFLSTHFKTIVKWWFYVNIIVLSFSILSFLIYSFYYWWAYVLSHFVTQTTLNILHSWFLSLVIFFIYKFLYKE